MPAEGVDDVETCIEAVGLIEAVVVGRAVDVALAVGFLEWVAIVDHVAEHLPADEFEVLIHSLFQDGVLAVLVVAGNIFLLFEFGKLCDE